MEYGTEYSDDLCWERETDMDNKRFNIGLLVANITDPFSNSVAKGAMREARRLGTDLIIFPGKYVGLESKHNTFDAKYEYQYNVLFDHAARSGLDYLIVAIGTIAYPYNVKQKLEFMKKFSDIPVLSVASDLEGYDHLVYDNSSGILDAIDHLAKQGKKHIGMMIGDLNNFECQERYMAYRQGLEKNGLEFKDCYIMPSDISEMCEEEAFELIERCPDIDAVLCVNDVIANVVYSAVRAHDKRIGRDIAVVGFDDQPFAAELDPPLATVRADAELLGSRSVQKAVHFLSGVPDDEKYVPTKFIARQSAFASVDIIGLNEVDFGTDPIQLRDKLLEILKDYDDDNDDILNIIYFCTDTVAMIRKELIDSEPADNTLNRFLDMIDRYFTRTGFMPEHISKAFSLLDTAFNWCRARCKDKSRHVLEKIYEYFYKRISGNVMASYREQKQSFKDTTHINNLFIRDTMMLDGVLRDSYSTILKRISDVGADTAFLYIFKEPIEHHMGEAFPDDVQWFFKSYAYGNETHSVSPIEQRISPHEIYKNKYLCAERQHVFIVADLYSAEMQYGIMLLEPRTTDFFEELELVIYQMFSAVRTIELLKKQEAMVSELHSRNLALEVTSFEDELTQVLNRRGLYVKADELISSSTECDFVVVYADMDNLKQVNDRYGHKEGDYCIKLTADILSRALGEGAVIGRIGGDEFVGVAPVSESCNAKLVTARCRELVGEFNDSMKKAYLFGMSTGTYECSLQNSYDLQNAINKADGMLYERKALKSKSIMRA